jgi:homoserine O-acetyltransferase
MIDHEIFEAGGLVLQSGATLRGARLAFKTHGRLNAAKDNAIVYATHYSGQHTDNASSSSPT